MAKDLSMLRVIDRLEVGPVQLQRQRLVAPYRVVVENRKDAIDLIYRFEEDVLDPNDPACLNLASIIAAQVAINYGLFCDEIVFHGCYDQIDEKFIDDMTRNTAREIYVKKFLEPNPFIEGPVANLPAVKRENYNTARLVFPQERKSPSVAAVSSDKDRFWNTERSRHAVLSSGGKDSLLTFALLREIGCEVHPVFINESGRHWFTALNAHRYFSANIPHTTRVWTNADRLFNWMLRHLPFVRPDYAQIRADIYPIRLWTVAVFLFGSLPILKKRGIGRLVIGDEYDTTRRLSHHGITHYDGLYDQSRYFDNTLTRYFNRKGWQVSQFSVLRPLSELLIEKILAERYPELQQHQVSCHAGHKEGDRIAPCGRCEKCRRIVTMLLALGADPRRCGYTDAQIEANLNSVVEKGLNQETDSFQHLLFLLQRRGLIKDIPAGADTVRSRTEVMKLKFDSERSPYETIPTALREPLYRICLNYADGAVKRSGRLWNDVDPLHDPEASRPYPFEASIRLINKEETAGLEVRSAQPTYRLGELTWPEAKKRFKEVDVALLPVGAIEQHGPHLPLDTDAFDAEYLAHRVAEACSSPKPLVLPLIPYGVSYHHDDFSGTISINPDTLSRLVIEIGMGAARHGITKLVIINGHGGNMPALNYAAQIINRDAHIFTCVDTGESSDTDIEAVTETPNDVHAGEIETSTAMAVRSEMVRTSAIRKFIPRFSIRYLNFSSKRGVSWYSHTSKISPTGVMGDPTKATAEKGKQIWQVMISNLVEFVEELKRLSLDELYQKKY